MVYRKTIAALAVLLSAGFAAGLSAEPSTQPAARLVAPDSALAALIDEALERNPALAASRSAALASGQAAQAEGTWSDPTLSLAAMNLPANSFALDQEPMTGLWLTASQAVPLTGRYRSAREAGRSEAKLRKEQSRAEALQLAEQLAQSWYDWAYLRAAGATVDSTITLVEELIAVTRTRYEAGEVPQQDLLRLQTEGHRLDEQRVELAQRARSAARRLATLAGRPAAQLPRAVPALPTAASSLDSLQLQQALHQHNPLLAAREALREAAELRRRAARQKLWPDLKLQAGYGLRQDAPGGTQRPDFITFGAAMALPIHAGSKQRRRIEQMELMERGAQQQLAQVRLDLDRRLADLLDEERRHTRQVAEYDEGIVPTAHAALNSAAAAYSVGKASVELLLGAESALYQARLHRLMHLRDRARVRASLAALVGGADLADPARTGKTATHAEERTR